MVERGKNMNVICVSKIIIKLIDYHNVTSIAYNASTDVYTIVDGDGSHTVSGSHYTVHII